MSDIDLPKRPAQHVTGDRAVSVFGYKLNCSWVTNESKRDYGWDILVTTTEEACVKNDFFVQLKGHKVLNYSANKSYISEKLDVKTVNYLLSKNVPVMLSVCDTVNGTLFYIWVNDDIKRIMSDNPDWSNQESVVFHLPTENVIEDSPEICNKIYEYVKNYYRRQANEREIIDVLSPSLGLKEKQLGNISSDDAFQVIRPALEKAGLVDDFAVDIRSLSPSDQELLRKVKEISNYLNRYMHKIAKQELDGMSEQVKGAVGSIRSKYHNNLGVYYNHHDDLEAAFGEFSKAAQIAPENYKAVSNVVLTEFELYRKGLSKAKHDEWIFTLDKIIKSHPDFFAAYRVKAYIIADSENAVAAEKYLSSTNAWEAEHVEARICIADTYVRENNMSEAERVLEDELCSESFAYWSLKGFVYLAVATELLSKDKEYYMTGMGPSSINHTKLLVAEEAYKKAYEIMLGYGLPSFSDDTIVNYSTVLHLLFKHEISLDICKQFLTRHPKNKTVKGSIASSLLALGKPEKAILYAKEAFENKPNNTKLKNYCICLFEADDHDECINVINNNIDSEIAKPEKGMLLSLLALSLNEIGKVSQSKDVLKLMKSDDVYAGEAICTEAVISRNNGLDREQSIKIFRDGKKLYPDNVILLTNYAANLNPDNNKEAEEIKDCFNRLIRLRELFPDEYRMYSRAVFTLGDLDTSLRIIQRASEKFPDDERVKYDLAFMYSETGDEENAYSVLEQYFSRSNSYSQIKNYAVLAYRTGRHGKAISLFQKALSKTTDKENKGELHCLLFELKRNANFPEKEILRHAYEYGRTVDPAQEQLEARYLSMFMLAPLRTEPDEEMTEWFKEAKRRLEAFLESNPDNPYLKSIKIDPVIPEEEKGKEILATVMAQVLPHRMNADMFKIAARNMPYPLAFKATNIGYGSIFEYWSHSIGSIDEADILNIFNNSNNLMDENIIAENSNSVIVDISALLTLAQFDLLEALNEFERVIMSRQTRDLIQAEVSGITPPHEIAIKLEKWRLENRIRIRIRPIRTDYEEEISETGLYLEKTSGIENIIGAGMGESIVLASQLKLPFYSDDSAMRYIASNEYRVQTFSFLSLLHRCELNGSITPEAVAELYARLIQSHYFHIPFGAIQLTRSLVIYLRSLRDCKPSSDSMVQHDILGTFLKQFGNTKIKDSTLMDVACEWWINLMEDDRFTDDLVKECMKFPSYAISMHSISTITQGRIDDEKERRLASLWFRLIIKAYGTNRKLIPRTWSNIKSVTECYYSDDEKRYIRMIYEMIPKYLVKLLSQANALTKEKKIEMVFSITSLLPDGSHDSDRHRIETYIQKLKPPFFSY